MTETKTYTGGCHCGKVRFEVQADLARVMACNCSICAKTGSIYAFVPKEQFTLKAGEENLTDYQFHKKVVHHLFCSVCGIRSFGRGVGPGGKEMCAVNVRCLDDVDIGALSVTTFDGKSL